MKKPDTPQRPTFTRRRLRNGLLSLLAIGLLALIVVPQNESLINSNFTTGYVLFGCLVFLTALNLRKRLSFLPKIGSASFWMQLHIYVGLSTFAIFGFHVAWRIPTGAFECLLAGLYLIVAFSGVYGLYVTRVLPKRLTAIPEEVIFERIPWRRQQISNQARSIVLEACQSTDVLARYYANQLARYLEQPRSLAYFVMPTGFKRRAMIAEIEEMDRFLAVEQREAGDRLGELIKQKDDLDYHQAIQGRLKIWLFVHIGLTYSLLLTAVLHLVVVHAFSGSTVLPSSAGAGT